jgi:hypothetical protein
MRVIGRCRDGIDVLEAPVECWCATSVGIHVQRASQRLIGGGNWHKPIEQGLQVETTPCHNQCSLPTLSEIIKHLPRDGQKLGCATLLIGEEKIKQMMWHLSLLGRGRLRRTDIHVPVELARINIDDLSVKRLGNGQRESRFPHSSGTN